MGDRERYGAASAPVGEAVFADRVDAGRELARRLGEHARREDLLVLGLARGGVPVAFEVARELGATLDVFLVRKLGLPGQEELAMGAIAMGGVRVMNEEVVRRAAVSGDAIAAVAAEEQRQLERQERELRGGEPPPRVEGRAVVLVDDGLATGSTMRAAVRALREGGAGRIVVAAPVATTEVCAALEAEADEVVCVRTPEPFLAVGAWYEDFPQVEDGEVRELLERSRER